MTDSHLARCLVAVAALLSFSGCSAAHRYGAEARYAPSFRGYVLAPDNGADDPARDDIVMLLRDPVTDRKIRCREELERWVRHYRTKAIDEVHDENWEIASPILMAPATVVAALGVDVAVIGIGVAMLPFELARSEGADSIYERGVEAFRREHWRESTSLLELSLVKGQRGLATYYLGIAYANDGRWNEARDALSAFVERSLVREVTAYRNAERWLRYLDEPLEPCKSRAPIAIRW
jgi:hypothetical protein